MRTGRFILFCALPRPCKPESARQAVMRCAAACRAAMHYVTFRQENGSAARNLHLIRPSGTFPSRGRLSRVVPRGGATQTTFAPIQKLSPL